MRRAFCILALGAGFLAAGPAVSRVATAAPADPAPARAGTAEPAPDTMTTYFVGLLYRGPAWTPERSPEVEKLQEAHLANIRKLADSGKLILAGPFSDSGDLRGMFVFKVASLEEARALCDTDPAVKAGRLRVEIHPWYSAKGIRAGG